MTALPLTSRMKTLFAISVLVMFAHKVECWLMHEWLDSPFFQWMYESGGILATGPEDAFGETVFLAFIAWLFAGLFMGYLVMRGGWGPIAALAVWGGTFLLEWHHVIRTLTEADYYVGTATSLAYLAVMALYWTELLRLVQRAPATPAPVAPTLPQEPTELWPHKVGDFTLV